MAKLVYVAWLSFELAFICRYLVETKNVRALHSYTLESNAKVPPFDIAYPWGNRGVCFLFPYYCRYEKANVSTRLFDGDDQVALISHNAAADGFGGKDSDVRVDVDEKESIWTPEN